MPKLNLPHLPCLLVYFVSHVLPLCFASFFYGHMLSSGFILVVLWWFSRWGRSGYRWLKLRSVRAGSASVDLKSRIQALMLFNKSCHLLILGYSARPWSNKPTVTAGWQLNGGLSLFVFRIVIRESDIAGLEGFYVGECSAWAAVIVGTCNSSPSVPAAGGASCCHFGSDLKMLETGVDHILDMNPQTRGWGRQFKCHIWDIYPLELCCVMHHMDISSTIILV